MKASTLKLTLFLMVAVTSTLALFLEDYYEAIILMGIAGLYMRDD